MVICHSYVSLPKGKSHQMTKLGTKVVKKKIINDLAINWVVNESSPSVGSMALGFSHVLNFNPSRMIIIPFSSHVTAMLDYSRAIVQSHIIVPINYALCHYHPTHTIHYYPITH